MMMIRQFTLQITLCVLLFHLPLFFQYSQARPNHYTFVVQDANYTRLCNTTKILTVNGQFPGPAIHVRQGDTITVDVINNGPYSITIHWHGVRMPRNPWTDGPAYITQCPIQPRRRFRQKVIFSHEEGTLWWHAHSDYSRATVHGPIIVHPLNGTTFPFRKKLAHGGQIPIILGEWWSQDIMQLYETFLHSGGDIATSDALTINGQPGDLYPCSRDNMFEFTVDYGKTYMLRVINVGMSEVMFFAVANHTLTVVGSDASYLKPFTSTYIAISPGQTIDVLLDANQKPDTYYMAAMQFSDGTHQMNNGTTTAVLRYSNILQYHRKNFPDLPGRTNTTAFVDFSRRLRSLADKHHRPVAGPPRKCDYSLFYVFAMNTFPCGGNETCMGPNMSRMATSINNISFQDPTISILEAYHFKIPGVYENGFPSRPPRFYNFTADELPSYVLTPWKGTKVRVLEFGTTVEIVFQGTSALGGAEHPIHLHGFSFYVMAIGLGNFNRSKHHSTFNFVDPPLMNTIGVPANGWAVIRFNANNPGVWFMHCHFDRHSAWGMNTAFIVKNGKSPDEKMLPRPRDMPPCCGSALFDLENSRCGPNHGGRAWTEG